jgi:hypothetical protein
MVVDPVEQEAGPRAGRRGMRLLGGVRPELPAPVQRNVGVWLALSLIVVVVGLDLVGGRKAQLLGLLVGPPILAASFVGPKRTLVVGLAALAAAIGYGKAVGVDLLAGAQAVARSRSGPRRCCRRWWHGCGWSGKGGCEELSAPMGRVRSWNLQGDRLIGQWGLSSDFGF